ncbi:MAG: hypothetical protein QM523_11060, partial [Candidatus Pacebacteria bacterium]|nr:hypothetical protein [Candidatus Paceibacterota bacterium]
TAFSNVTNGKAGIAANLFKGDGFSFTGKSRYYFTSLAADSDEFKAAQAELKAIDADAELYNYGDMTRFAAATSGVDPASGQTITWNKAPSSTTRVTLPSQIGFFKFNSRASLFDSATQNFVANTELTFLGRNSFGSSHDLSTYTVKGSTNKSITRISFADDAVVTSALTLPSNVKLVVGSGVSLPNLTSSDGTGQLNLVLTDRLIQAAGTQYSFSGGIKLSSLTGNSVSLWLTSRANQISQISGNTNGGSISVVTNTTNLKLVGLNTGGGSVVVVNSGGGLSSDQYVNLGSVGFRLTGAVDLQGKIASASGSASSVNLNSQSAGFVVGNVSSDTGVTVAGENKTVILTGTVTAKSSPIEIAPKTVVAGTVELYSASRVELATVNSISQTLAGLRVVANTIVMKGAIGSTAKLGWVEFIAPNLSNPQAYAINYNGGSVNPASQTDFKGPRWPN